MPSVYIFGFAHQDLNAARVTIQTALSIHLEEFAEEDGNGCYFRVELPSGPAVQLRSNSGPCQRWKGDPSNPWYPDYGILIWVHGPASESIASRLQNGVPSLAFLEQRDMGC